MPREIPERDAEGRVGYADEEGGLGSASNAASTGADRGKDDIVTSLCERAGCRAAIDSATPRAVNQLIWFDSHTLSWLSIEIAASTDLPLGLMREICGSQGSWRARERGRRLIITLDCGKARGLGQGVSTDEESQDDIYFSKYPRNVRTSIYIRAWT